MRRTPIIHTLRSDGTYTTAAALASDTGATPTFARNCVAYRDYWDGSSRKLVEVPANVPRWCTRKDTGGTAHSGLLIEPEKTNIYINSHDLSKWAHDNAEATSGQAFIDGTTDACTVRNYPSTFGSRAIYQDFSGLTAGQQFCYSIFCKTVTIPYVCLYQFASPTTRYVGFKFADMSIANPNSLLCGYENWGDGWYLLWFSDTFLAAGMYMGIYLSVDGTLGQYPDGANKSLLACGAQLLAGSYYPTSRIKSTTAPATRLKDVISYDVTGRIGQRGSLVFDVLFPDHDLSANVVPVCLHDGTANNRITCSILATGDKASATVVSGGDTQADITDATTDVVDGDKHTIAISWEPNSIKLYVDGTLEGTADTEATIPSGITTLTLGDHDGANQPNAMISDLKIYNRPGVTS